MPSEEIKDIIQKYEGKQINVSLEENLIINVRHNSIKRCLINLIDNGLSYGKKVEIFCNKTRKNIFNFTKCL